VVELSIERAAIQRFSERSCRGSASGSFVSAPRWSAQGGVCCSRRLRENYPLW